MANKSPTFFKIIRNVFGFRQSCAQQDTSAKLGKKSIPQVLHLLISMRNGRKIPENDRDIESDRNSSENLKQLE